MSISCGIVGLPNAGKSTLFKLMTSVPVEIASYPFSTVDPNTGVIPLEDQRLNELYRVAQSSKVTYARLTVVDVAGLVKGASRGEGLGNQFLAQIREMDLIIHVVGDFNLEESLPGGEMSLNPVEKARDVNLELILADLSTVEKRWDKTSRKSKSGEKEVLEEQELLERLYRHLNNELPARSFPRSQKEARYMKDMNLLSDKRVVYVLNRGEEKINQEIPPDFYEFVKKEEAPLIPVCAKLELELKDLEEDEKEIFKQEYSLQKEALPEIIRACYRQLEMITFFTVKGEEARAWLAQEGTTVIEAAGKIHTDMQKGFRAVEVVSCQDLIEAGNLAAARESGRARVEGKDYRVNEGDVLFIRFVA